MMSGTAKHISLNAALENMSFELDRLAQKTLALDEALGEAIGSPDAAGALPLDLLQDVDLVRQSADCLRIVMGNLVKMSGTAPQPPDFLETRAVIDGVYLPALRDRVVAAPDVPVERVAGMGDWIDICRPHLDGVISARATALRREFRLPFCGSCSLPDPKASR